MAMHGVEYSGHGRLMIDYEIIKHPEKLKTDFKKKPAGVETIEKKNWLLPVYKFFGLARNVKLDINGKKEDVVIWVPSAKEFLIRNEALTKKGAKEVSADDVAKMIKSTFSIAQQYVAQEYKKFTKQLNDDKALHKIYDEIVARAARSLDAHEGGCFIDEQQMKNFLQRLSPYMPDQKITVFDKIQKKERRCPLLEALCCCLPSSKSEIVISQEASKARQFDLGNFRENLKELMVQRDGQTVFDVSEKKLEKFLASLPIFEEDTQLDARYEELKQELAHEREGSGKVQLEEDKKLIEIIKTLRKKKQKAQTTPTESFRLTPPAQMPNGPKSVAVKPVTPPKPVVSPMPLMDEVISIFDSQLRNQNKEIHGSMEDFLKIFQWLDQLGYKLPLTQEERREFIFQNSNANQGILQVRMSSLMELMADLGNNARIVSQDDVTSQKAKNIVGLFNDGIEDVIAERKRRDKDLEYLVNIFAGMKANEAGTGDISGKQIVLRDPKGHGGQIIQYGSDRIDISPKVTQNNAREITLALRQGSKTLPHQRLALSVEDLENVLRNFGIRQDRIDQFLLKLSQKYFADALDRQINLFLQGNLEEPIIPTNAIILWEGMPTDLASLKEFIDQNRGPRTRIEEIEEIAGLEDEEQELPAIQRRKIKEPTWIEDSLNDYRGANQLASVLQSFSTMANKLNKQQGMHLATQDPHNGQDFIYFIYGLGRIEGTKMLRNDRREIIKIKYSDRSININLDNVKEGYKKLPLQEKLWLYQLACQDNALLSDASKDGVIEFLKNGLENALMTASPEEIEGIKAYIHKNIENRPELAEVEIR